jgi:hypothetical protein
MRNSNSQIEPIEMMFVAAYYKDSHNRFKSLIDALLYLLQYLNILLIEFLIIFKL